MGEIPRSPEQDFLPLESVFALRALALGVVGRRAGKWLDAPKTSGFSMREATGDEIGSGTLERYLGVIAKRVDYDYWQMTIFFRETRLSEETLNSSVLVQNRFNWNRQGTCLGTKSISLINADLPESTERLDSKVVTASPIFAEDLPEIADELQEVSRSATGYSLRRFAFKIMNEADNRGEM